MGSDARFGAGLGGRAMMHHKIRYIAGIAVVAITLPMAAQAQCSNVGTRVKCLFTGPSAMARADRKAQMSARFVAVPALPSDRAGQTDRKQIRKATLPQPRKVPDQRFDQGQPLPATFLILMNPMRHGLPEPRDGWAYFHVGSEIYRAELTSRRVLDYVTPHLANF